MQRQWTLPKFEGYNSLKLVDARTPRPGPGEVLVKMHAVSLNFRELLISENLYPGHKEPGVVPGCDPAGSIVGVGAGVTAWKVGDRVTANFMLKYLAGRASLETNASAMGGEVPGTLTQFRCFPAEALVRIADHLTYEQASTLSCAGVTAYNALMAPVPLKGGDTVVIQGTGGVSMLGLQIALASGARVIALSSSDEKLNVVKGLGAHHVINYNTTPDWDAEVLRLTNGEGADHVLDVGGSATLEKSMRAARFGGCVSIIGFVGGMTTPPDVVVPAIVRGITLRGVLVGSRAQFEDLMRLVDAQKIIPVVDQVFAFEQAPAAYKYLKEQKHVGKVVIKIA